MKTFLMITLILFSLSVRAQLSTLQDDSAIHWRKIENDYFEVIYPEHVEEQAQYILQLLNHYRQQVSKTYRYQSQKVSLVLRANTADPNGFVTLAPRRSEWFMSAAYSPFVGSLEWYQTLAVHEYRHVVQFDFLNRSNMQIGYGFGGETFLSLLIGISVPNWYFEGDAVWVETIFSNAGRGRSPRFSARLKSLITGNSPVSFDQLLAGDFTNSLPNHYVYGYFFITRAIVLYGQDIWYHVAGRATDEPLNPYALYDAFYEVTGKDFDQFYQETVEELKTSWGINPEQIPLGNYTAQAWPKIDEGKLYYLQKDLDHFWRLIEKTDHEKTIVELNLYPSLSKVDLKAGKFVYSQNRPHHRYAYKNFADLYLLDLNTKEQKLISQSKRFYHPQLNSTATQILAMEYNDQNKWDAVILDLKGKELNRIASLPDLKIVETAWRDDTSLVAIVLQPNGMKQLATINLTTKELKPFSPATRNNLFALHMDKELYFEADDLGTVNIFSYNFAKEEFSKCTSEFIGGFQPYSNQGQLYYSRLTVNGSEIKQITKDCSPVVSADIFKNYLGNSPSDNFTQSKPITIQDFSSLTSAKVEHQDYPEYKSAFSPHSWSFLGGRGYEINVTTSNILGSLGLNAYVGSNPLEDAPYVGFALQYSKFYPLFSFGIDHAGRKVQINEEDVKWNELTARFQMTLPHIYQNHLYQGSNFLSFFADHIQVSDKEQVTEAFELDDQQLNGLGVNLTSSYLKQQLPKELFPRHGIFANYFYEDLKTAGDSESLSYLGSYTLKMFHPGLWQHHGFKLEGSGEYRPESKELYRQQREYVPIIGYNFSRGYAYEFTPRFNKVALDYTFTLGYPNLGYKDWIYFTRIYTQLFFDHTKSDYLESDRTLNSYGAEFYFNSLTFRKFPLTYGLRVLKRMQDNTNQLEFFISLF